MKSDIEGHHTMPSKSLSTSTLSLRFMQNAHRAKQLKEVELERAEVKDDEKWEVSQEIRESWGTANNAQSESPDVHEMSYLPFLFSESDTVGNDDSGNGASIKQASGRRVFNKKGELVPLASSSSSKETAPTSTPSSSGLTTSASRKVHSRPVSISASGTSSHLRGFEQPAKAKDASKHSKSAREAIFENSGVGTDLRSEGRKDKPIFTTSTFLKPMGVDDPKGIKVAEGIINGARQKKEAKRERDATPGESNEVAKKSKKKRKNPE